MGQIYTGKRPYAGYRALDTLINATVGRLPKRPEDSTEIELDDDMWALIQDCWKYDPSQRPDMDAVVNRLRSIPHPEPT